MGTPTKKKPSNKDWAYGMFGDEEMDRVLIKDSPIQKTRVWFIGDTGNGKTTTVGKLSACSDIKGKDGFSHDTKRIMEYEFSYIHKPDESEKQATIYCNVLVDTRGTSDIGVDVHYSAKDLFTDMNTHFSYVESSKVVFVIMNRRLQPGQLKMIRDLYNAFQSKFLILITGTMDHDGRSRNELLKLLKTNGIAFTGKILAVDWFYHAEPEEDELHIVSARRYKILDALESLPAVNVRLLSPHGLVVRWLNRMENKCLEMFQVRYAVDGILLGLMGLCTITWALSDGRSNRRTNVHSLRR